MTNNLSKTVARRLATQTDPKLVIEDLLVERDKLIRDNEDLHEHATLLEAHITKLQVEITELKRLLP